MKRLKLLFATAPLLLLALPGVASAHILKQDNGISAVLHIPPDDNPVAGQSTELDLSFGDEANAFSLVDCHCQVAIKNDSGTIIYQAPPKPALQGATLDSIVNFNFPKIGVYNLIVSGSSTNASFRTFHLDYLVRVASSVNGQAMATSGQGSEVIVIGIGSLSILGLFAFTAMRAGGRYVTVPVPKRAKAKPANRKSKES